MKPTNDKFFLDSNVLLYLVNETAPAKKLKAKLLVAEGAFLSPQVLFECLNVCLRKMQMDKFRAINFIRYLNNVCFLQAETDSTIDAALRVFKKHLLQPYDSKIVASALVAGCTILYSEDMQHGLIIESSLTILNPFR